MNRKIVYLILALCLPVIVFIFLKTFGKNQFDIPVYYQTGVENTFPCAPKNTEPYLVRDSVLEKMRWRKDVPLLVCSDTSVITKANLLRLKNDFSESEYQIVFLSQAKKVESEWLSCVFFLEKPWTAVLMDTGQRIRGYYTPSTLDETDRVMVEMRILLKKY